MSFATGLPAAAAAARFTGGGVPGPAGLANFLVDTFKTEIASDPKFSNKFVQNIVQQDGLKQNFDPEQQTLIAQLAASLVLQESSGNGTLSGPVVEQLLVELAKQTGMDSASRTVMSNIIDAGLAAKERSGEEVVQEVAGTVQKEAKQAAQEVAKEVAKEHGRKIIDTFIKGTDISEQDAQTFGSSEADIKDRTQAAKRLAKKIVQSTDTQTHRSIELNQTMHANSRQILRELNIEENATFQVYHNAQQRPSDIDNVNVANCVRILCNAKNDFEGQKLLLDLFIRKLEQYSSEDVEQQPVAKEDKAAEADQSSLLGWIAAGAAVGAAGTAAYANRDKIKKGVKKGISWALKKSAQLLLRCMRDNPKLAIVITALIMYQLKQMAALIQSLALFSLHSGAGHIAFMYIVSTVVIPAVIERIKRNVMTAFAISIVVVVIAFAWKYKDQLKDQASKAARSLMVKKTKKLLGLGAHANRESVILRQNKVFRDNETNQNCSAGPGRLTMRACRFQSNC